MFRTSRGSRFRIFRFIPIPNGKFTHFLIFYAVRTFGLAKVLVLFGRFVGSNFSFERTNLSCQLIIFEHSKFQFTTDDQTRHVNI